MRLIGLLLLLGLQQPVYYPYADGCKQSIDSGKPLVVFVGHIPAVYVEGAIHAVAPTLEGYPTSCIVVSTPSKGSNYWKATLSATATDGQILAALKTKEVATVVAAPFRQQHCPT